MLRVPKVSLFSSSGDALVMDIQGFILCSKVRSLLTRAACADGAAGVAMDGLPEAVLIGLLAMQNRMSFPFIASVFISNFPEAMSCAAMSKRQGMRPHWVMLMWTSLCVMTGEHPLLAKLQALHGLEGSSYVFGLFVFRSATCWLSDVLRCKW